MTPLSSRQGPLDWAVDGPHWPHAGRSGFVTAGGLRWHVQTWPGPAPDAPALLLLHGTGASTHSWRGLAPRLAARWRVIAPDLPGHAFTGLPPGGAADPRLSLPGMAGAVADLVAALSVTPDLVVGHSAGAAVAVQMALAGRCTPRRLVGLNAALLPLGGLVGPLFRPLARLVAAAPGVPRLAAWQTRQPAVLRGLIDSTGSRLDAEGTALYRRLVASAVHHEGVLGMMAQWDLPGLARALPGLAVPLDLLVGLADATVPPAQAAEVMQRLAPAVRGALHALPALGHLAHEEDPAAVADWLIGR